MQVDECKKYELHENEGISILQSKTNETIVCTKNQLLEICGHCEEQVEDDCPKIREFRRKLMK